MYNMIYFAGCQEERKKWPDATVVSNGITNHVKKFLVAYSLRVKSGLAALVILNISIANCIICSMHAFCLYCVYVFTDERAQ